MRYRTLGAGLTVSAVGLGCLGMSGGYGEADEARCRDTIRTGLDHGLTLLDTADFYGAGGNEELVGRAIAGRRDEVVLATRGGLRSARPGGPPTVRDGRPEYLRQACHASLRRLGVDRIDLYYLGRVDPEVPVEDSVGALAELVEEGLIGHIGLSEASADELERACAVHPITALESEYSVWERHIEDELLPVARRLGVGLVAHTPLGKGLLTGALSTVTGFGPGDYRSNHPRFVAENLEHNQRLVAAAEAELLSTGVPLAQLALAWLLSRGDDVVAIPGTTRVRHLLGNLAAADLEVDPVVLAALADRLAPSDVRGERVPVRR